MNTNLSITKQAGPPGSDDSLPFKATLLPEGVSVEVGHVSWPVPWDKVPDVEQLSEMFWNLQVWEFKIVVDMLGQAYRAKELLAE